MVSSIAPDVPQEIVADPARTTQVVLNMLSTGTFIRRGYVFGNLMVNVQPKNSKLRDRARRIVEKAAGVNEERASELLDAAGDSVRIAIVMQRAGVGRAAAERLLDAAGGRVAMALQKARHG